MHHHHSVRQDDAEAQKLSHDYFLKYVLTFQMSTREKGWMPTKLSYAKSTRIKQAQGFQEIG